MPQARDHITRRSLVAAFALPVIPALPLAVPPLLAVAAALPPPDFASAPSGLPATPDPVFAAMEAHTRAFREFDAVLDALAVAEQEAWHAPRGQRRAAKKRLAEARAAERQFGDPAFAARGRLVATIPQTLSGAAAMLAYVREHFEEGFAIGDEDETIALLGSIECVVCRAAGLPIPARP